MSNRILSKKIKFPLSLRGTFPHVIARERSDRSNLNSGFSLIELMVAVTVLAMAIFGIFLAFTTGFQGMADARDRTVATNYAQEAMENIKNMDFEKIATTTRSVTDGNRKYRIDVNLIEASDTFKKVYTVVSWIDRNGETKTVDSSLTVNFTEVFASDAAKIVLFADSYSILNDPSSEYSSTDIIAVIKDINGNTITDWEEGDVTFEIISTELFGKFPGGVSVIDETPVEGKANTTFSSDGTFSADEAPTENYYVLQKIKASVTIPDVGEVTDTTTIKITDGPVKITLEADPESVKAGVGNYSTITASVRNAAGNILSKKDIFNAIEITFNASGEGKFENDSTTYTDTIPYNSGSEEPATVTVNLYSTGTDNPGVVNLLATSLNLESGSANVTFLGPPVAISISANPSSIYVDDTEGSTISVSLVDSNGYSTNPTVSPITILLSLTDYGTGGSIEEPSSWVIPVSDSEGIINTTKFSGQNDTGTARIDASAVGLTGEYYVTITVDSSLVPDHIELEVMGDNNIPADGSTTAIIKATVYDESGKVVTTYPGTITFNITGTGNFSNFNIINGIATIEISSSAPGTATITVTSSDSLPSEPAEGVEVKFYGTADHIKLEANKSMVKAGGTDYATITATVCDIGGSTITNYTGTITFNIIGTGNFSNFNIINGIATIEISSSAPGTATITVTSSDSLPNEPTEGVEVIFYEETTLELVPETTRYEEGSENKIITFDVKVTGENIVVDEMKIIWTSHPNQKLLSNISIDEVEVYSYSGNIASGITVDIDDTTLYSGESNVSTIKLTFAQDMTDKFPIQVYFNSGPDQYDITLIEEDFVITP